MARKKIEQPFYVGDIISHRQATDVNEAWKVISIDMEKLHNGIINWQVGVKRQSDGFEACYDVQHIKPELKNPYYPGWNIITPSLERLFKIS